MRIRTTLLALGLALGTMALAPAFAAGTQTSHHKTEHKTMTAQQRKMADCSHRSKGMKGEAHKKFMSECLHGKTTAHHEKHHKAKSEHAMHGKHSQREKMKTCNASAKSKHLKGAARKSFMSHCLKG